MGFFIGDEVGYVEWMFQRTRTRVQVKDSTLNIESITVTIHLSGTIARLSFSGFF
jgi:hypothetical protein